MSDNQQRAINELSDRVSSAAYDWAAYWRTYSNMSTWQFWVLLFILLAPLVLLAFRMDRAQAFRIGFYGFAVHVSAIYVDSYATTHSMWQYPYKAFPIPTSSFALDASLIPVAYMLLYQWTLNKRKNYYIWILLMAAFFAFVLKPLFAWLGLFQLRESSYWELLLFYVAGGLISKWLTDLFSLAHKQSKN